MEISLVAEGWRKLATLTRLIDAGRLPDNACLFWDEPESNLNPKLIREVAKAILTICEAGAPSDCGDAQPLPPERVRGSPQA